MTALAGFCGSADEDDARRECAAMLRAQAQYADTPPQIDSHGACVLGRALYRTVPEDRFDTGPLTGGDGGLSLVADIRLDDRAGLIAALALPPGAAARLSDADLLLRGWEAWGEDILPRLNADFALALWDARRQELILARDFMGQRPLFHCQTGQGTAFASMPAGLLARSDSVRCPDAQAMATYIGLMPGTGPRSFFEGIERVRPGHLLRITANGPREERFWSPPRRRLTLDDPAAYTGMTLERLDRAVAARMRGTGPLASHLSAGMDSAAVTDSAARQLGPGQRIIALTAAPPEGFDAVPPPPGRFFDEAPLAAQVAAAHDGIDHLVIRSDSADPSAAWDRAFVLFQAPLPNPCNYLWSTALNDAAQARGARVLLTAQLGNLSFSYAARAHYANLLARGSLRDWARQISKARHLGRSAVSLGLDTVHPLCPAWALRALARLRGRSGSLSDHDFAAAGAAQPEGAIPTSQRIRDSHAERMQALEWLDFGIYNKGILAGWGLDTRDPTADRELVELCLSIPDAIYQREGRDRALARAMMAGRLPDAIVTGLRRGYQAADWRRGILNARASLTEQNRRSGHVPFAQDLIDTAAVERALAALSEDERPGQGDELTVRLGLLRALAAGHFIRKATGSNQ